MANNYNAIYKRFNGTDWDTFYFATLASQVSETLTRKWMTPNEQTAVNTYLLSDFNIANQLVQLDSTGKVPSGLIDANFTDFVRRDGTLAMTGDLNMGSNNIIGVKQIDLGSSREITWDGPQGPRIYGGGTNQNSTFFIISEETEIESKINARENATFDKDIINGNILMNGNSIRFHDNEVIIQGTSPEHNYPNQLWLSGSGGVEITTSGNPIFLNGNSVDVLNTKIVNVADGTNDKDAVNYGQLVSVAMDGLKPMPPVRVATTGNITTTGLLTVDGVQLVASDRVLVKNQSTASQNGIYTVNSGAWTKINAQSQKGFYGQVLEGTVNRGTWYYADTNTSWELHSMPDEYGVISGGGLQLVGMNFGIEAGKVTNAMLEGSIANTKLASWTGAENVTPTAATTSKSLSVHINQLYTQIKNIRGTTNFNTAVTDTILSVKGIADSKNKTYIGNANPSTTGYNSGDLYFQYT